MLLLDVNILIHAHRGESPEHPAISSFLHRLCDGPASFGIPETVFLSLVRITTQPFWKPPSTLDQAIGFCNQLRALDHCLVLHPTDTHWSQFEQLCRRTNAKGKLVADAYLAAFALDRDDEWITIDRDFAKFPGLRWRHPLETRIHTNPR